MNKAMLLYKRAAKIKALTILKNEQEKPMDKSSISTESKKEQVIRLTKTEVLEKIRKTE